MGSLHSQVPIWRNKESVLITVIERSSLSAAAIAVAVVFVTYVCTELGIYLSI